MAKTGTEAAVVETAAPAETPASVATPGEQRDKLPRTIDELAAKFVQEMGQDESAKTDTETAAEEAAAKAAEEAAAKAAEETPGSKEAETPVYDPKALGLPEPYWNCKTPAEAVQLAEKRRADAEVLAHSHDTELGELRKARDAVKPPETAKPEATATPVEWTPEQRADWQRMHDETPEQALGWLANQIQGPLVAKIAALETRLAAAEGKAEKIVSESAAEKEAREDREANEEFSAFAREHPDVKDMRGEAGPLAKAYKAVNDGRPRGDFNEVYADVYGVAKLQTSKIPDEQKLAAEIVKHMRRGCRFDEAKEIAEAVRDRTKHEHAEKARLAEEAKRKGRIGSAGKGAGSPGSNPVTETNLDTYLHNRQLPK